MKFAKELDQDLVPEWRAKYLNYKIGKKKVKGVARALAKVHQPTNSAATRTPDRQRPSFADQFPSYLSSVPHTPSGDEETLTENLWNKRGYEQTASGSRTNIRSSDASTAVRSLHSAVGYDHAGANPNLPSERQPLRGQGNGSHRTQMSGLGYGSILSTPQTSSVPVGPPSLELPDPALSPSQSFPSHPQAGGHYEANPPVRRTASVAGDAYEVGRTHTPSKFNATLLPKHRNIFRPRRTFSTPHGGVPRHSHFLKRAFSGHKGPSPYLSDVPLESYKDFELRQADFFVFLDKELDKIESFYKMKEDEATKRLEQLKDQLHEMRDRRVAEMLAAQHKRLTGSTDVEDDDGIATNGDHLFGTKDLHNDGFRHDWVRPLENAIGIGQPHFGKGSRAMEQLGTPADHRVRRPQPYNIDSHRDFARRVSPEEVPYRLARKKLKLALQEFYRGLELLKSYALLNRTAFRKINKKYDKAAQARPTGRYMSERVNQAWFVQSELLERYLVTVEDLYARYFERGNHKIAVGKLRSKQARDSFSASVFRNGLLFAAGLVLGVEGVVYGSAQLYNEDPIIVTQTGFLLQLYAGYFLSLFLFILFCLACKVWVNAKINYIFIFEFDTRHNLDWRQLSEIPCFLVFLLGLAMWLNFKQPSDSVMFLYWPVILIFLTILILFMPVKALYHRSRLWWAYANFRLLHAGLYPVEFRDFFLGDMYCSLTYAMGNIEVFFCLYANGWNDPAQCNSSNSRLFGFLSCLPGIWRAFQCLRRYSDTRNGFPHLVNFGKYMCTILFYMSLSLYRINEWPSLKILFIFFATVNSIYVSIWDLAMDWSLGNPYAPDPFLREVLGYKRAWVYYTAMVIDPILRFNWVFYVVLDDEIQHSALLSFLVSFSEICRRAMWTLFRVENEHCTNVVRFRASRDVPLPYELDPSDEPFADHERAPLHTPPSSRDLSPRTTIREQGDGAPVDIEQAPSESSRPHLNAIRRRMTVANIIGETPISRGLGRVGTIMAEAHAQDFERRRRPGVADLGRGRKDDSGGSSDDEEEERNRVEDEEIDMERREAGGILDRHPSAREGG